MENKLKYKIMSEKLEPYKVTMTKFLGSDENGNHTYEITFNQSIVHTGRFTGIEDGLNQYRENEIKEHEQDILKQAKRIQDKQIQP